MKINSHNPLSRPAPTTPREEASKTREGDRPNQPESTTAAKTHLSQAGTDASRDIDTAKVEEIREAIREGRLEIRPSASPMA